MYLTNSSHWKASTRAKVKILLMLTGVGATGMVHFLSEVLRGPVF